jgi:fumarate reductase flavoprotein subunit
VAPNDAWDFLVVGGGLAGLTAALRAAELGSRVAVLERGEGEAYPCNSRYSGGIIHIAFHDVKRPREELLAVIKRVTNGEAQDDLADAVATDARRLIDWLQGHGTRFMRFNPQEGYKWCMAPARRLTPGLDWKGRGPDVTLRRLEAGLIARGGMVARGSEVRSLIMEGGRCVGVIAAKEGAEMRWLARAVLIADGGFQSDRVSFEQHIGPRYDRVLQRGAATGRGDGHRMAAEAGAALTDRSRFYGHLLNLAALTNDRVWPYPEVDFIACASLVVNSAGRRFVDEGLGGIAITNALARSDDPSSAHVILDAAIWDGPGKAARIPANPLLEQAGGTLHRAMTLDELAGRAGLPAGALAATVSAYNEAVGKGGLSMLTPPRTDDTYKPMPVATPPLMAIPICPGITYTMGGLAIDGYGRVLRPDGSVVAGLYAAGSTTGGLEGGGRVGYIGGLVKAGVTGLRVGEHVAQASSDT